MPTAALVTTPAVHLIPTEERRELGWIEHGMPQMPSR
jgi:hypothetical protein